MHRSTRPRFARSHSGTWIRCDRPHALESNGYCGLMQSPILVCADGSDRSMTTLSLGLGLLEHSNELVLVTVATAQIRPRLPAPDTLGLTCNRSSTTKRSNKPTGVRIL